MNQLTPIRVPAALSGPSMPRPPLPARQRTQLESFFVLRRNTLELWGAPAYEEEILPGRFLGRDQLMLNDPEAIRHVLVTNSDNYARNAATHRVLQPLLGGGLFLAEGESWRHRRRTIAPAMTPRTMPVVARHVVTATEATEAGLLGARGSVLLLPVLQRLALDIAAVSMFSLEAASFAPRLREMLTRYGLRFAAPSLLDLVLPGGVPSPIDFGRAAFRREWLAMMDRIIDRREKLPPAADQPRDLFDLLAAARDPQDGAGFDRAMLRDEVSTMIIAGHETTAVTLFWACYAAARLPGAQSRIAAEVAGLDLSADKAAEAIRSLIFTRAFIDEVLRLYPPAFLIVREAKEPDIIAGHRIAAGTAVSVSPWILHRHRKRWHDPDSFDPRRFLPGATPPERYAYMPFGAGPRICVGAQFALTEAVLVLARLIQRFSLELAGSGAVTPRGFVTTQPDRPVRFFIRPRA